MQLKLKNVGLIKVANIRLDGLTVIAGENDSGKSTVGKIVFSILKSRDDTFNVFPLIFGSDTIYKNSDILFETENCTYTRVHDSVFKTYLDTKPKDIDVIFVESPLVWNLQEFFNTTVQIESRLSQIGENISIPYPYLMKDLDFKLHTKKPNTEDSITFTKNIKNNLVEIMNGEFIKNDQSNMYYFHRKNETYDLLNVATGIKYFGLIQVLIDNNRLHKDIILVLDEPEVHLHPKWQLRLAEVIVYLTKNGIKVLVNSHSPYMIEALQRYSEQENLADKTNFYLAQDGVIAKKDDSNSATLSEIFEKLSEPFDEFEAMESERLNHG